MAQWVLCVVARNDPDVVGVADAFNVSFAKFRRNKGAVTLMSYTEEIEATSRAEGEARGRAETARAMLRRGMDVALIMDVTGISSETMQALQKEAAGELP